MISSPAVTVLMPVYNAGKFLAESIPSILGQSLTDLELLIVDDGSTDDSMAIVRSHPDERIRVLRQTRNLGIVAALNRGIAEAKAPLIARMDADDVALPDRLATQCGALNRSPSLAVLGSDFEPFGGRQHQSWIKYHSPVDIRIALLFENPLCHPTVVMKREVVRATSYPDDYPHAEEYALWQLLAEDHDLANHRQSLLRYRAHDQQISVRRSEEQCHSIDRLMRRQLSALGLSPSENELRLHQTLGQAFCPLPGLATALATWTETLIEANRRTSRYPHEAFSAQLKERRTAALQRTARTLRTMPWWRRARWQLRTAFRMRDVTTR